LRSDDEGSSIVSSDPEYRWCVVGVL